MADLPKRIQLSRAKGWRIPTGVVVVSRPSKWGNPFTPFGCAEAGYSGTAEQLRQRCVEAFRVWIDTPHWRNNWQGPEAEATRDRMLTRMAELRGKDLACWCALDKPCHADVLLEIANRNPIEQVNNG